MFNIESIIDTVHGAQKSFLETYVADKKVQAELIKLTEAQAKFAKGSYQTTLGLAQAVYKSATEVVQSKKGA